MAKINSWGCVCTDRCIEVVSLEDHEATLPEVRVVALKPGDTLVITYPGPVSYDQAARMKESLGQMILPGVKCLVLGDDPKLSILRSEAQRAPDQPSVSLDPHQMVCPSCGQPSGKGMDMFAYMAELITKHPTAKGMLDLAMARATIPTPSASGAPNA